MKNITIILLVCMLLPLSVSGENEGDKPLRLKLDKVSESGRNTMIYSAGSICEDNEGGFYVLDYKAWKIHRFDKGGKRQLTFGNRGQGPGDMNQPHFITGIGQNTVGKPAIVMCEPIEFVSFFDPNGTFLERIRIPKGLGLSFITSNLYYAWVWTKKSRQQVLLDKKGNILKTFFESPKDASSISAPDETGRLVMINHFAEEYTPFLLFSGTKNRAALGISNRYEVKLVDRNGNVSATLTRPIRPPDITPKEREHFKQQIYGRNNLHDLAKKKLADKIPRLKNHFTAIRLSSTHVFLFRLKSDILNRNALIPVDIFTFGGTYVGTGRVKRVPVFVSDKFMYVKEFTEEDELLVVKYKYGF